jgi:hypothetical protein
MIESRRQKKERAIVIPTGLGWWPRPFFLAYLRLAPETGARSVLRLPFFDRVKLVFGNATGLEQTL